MQFHAVDDEDGTRRARPDVRWAREASAHHYPTAGLSASRTRTWRPAGHPGRPASSAWRGGGRRRAARSTWTVPGCSTPRWRPAWPRPTSPGTATTVMSCLSKGLCAPVGSVSAGPLDVIEEARIERQAPRRRDAPGGGAGRGRAGGAQPRWWIAWPTITCGPDDWPTPWRSAGRSAGSIRRRCRTNIIIFAHAAPRQLIDALSADGVLGRHDRAGRRAPRHPSRRGRRRDRAGRRGTGGRPLVEPPGVSAAPRSGARKGGSALGRSGAGR